jgi:rod shape-determining protein MreC
MYLILFVPMNNLIKYILRYKAAIIFVVLEIIAFMLIFNNSYYPQTQMYGVMQHFQTYWYATAENLTEYIALKEDNERLAAENAALRSKLQLFQSRDSLQPYIAYTNTGRYTHYPAKITNNSINKQFNYITLNIGSNNGIHVDMGVVADDCIVGVVVNTSPHFSTVMSVLNKKLKINARLKNTMHHGSLIWDGIYYRSALLTEVPQHAKITIGDTVVTSGYSALFPEGILIGTVVDFSVKKGSFYEINVHLLTDFNSLRYVEVIDNSLQIEQEELEEQQYKN